MFDFSGSFGHNTIYDFLASGSPHDVVDFANDTFTSYAELQSDMAQVGKNVVITLDATDTIILKSVSLAALVSHDFIFG